MLIRIGRAMLFVNELDRLFVATLLEANVLVSVH
jgi:hypothetical protein